MASQGSSCGIALAQGHSHGCESLGKCGMWNNMRGIGKSGLLININPLLPST